MMTMLRKLMMLVPHPKVLTPEEDEEQLIMRRMRNSVDELRRGYRFLILISSTLLPDLHPGFTIQPLLTICCWTGGWTTGCKG